MADIEELTTRKAEEIAEQRYGREFYNLPNNIQYKVWSEAEREVMDNIAAQADLLRNDLKTPR